MPELAICHCYTPSHFLSPPTLGAEKNTASLCVSSTNASAVLQQRFNVENVNPPPENQELGFRAAMPVPVATASLMHSALTNSVSCVAYCDCSPPSCKSGKLDNNNYTYIGNAFVLPAERKKKEHLEFNNKVHKYMPVHPNIFFDGCWRFCICWVAGGLIIGLLALFPFFLFFFFVFCWVSKTNYKLKC